MSVALNWVFFLLECSCSTPEFSKRNTEDDVVWRLLQTWPPSFRTPMIYALLLATLAASASAFHLPAAALHHTPARAALRMEAPTEPKATQPKATYPAASFADGPSDDPLVTCFLAPGYMGAADEKWVCMNHSELRKADTTGAEDSY